MDLETQFWMTWWVRLAGTAGTLLAVLVALFGEYFKARLFVPKLTVDLMSPIGSKTPITLKEPDGTARTESARYYQLRLKNENGWPRATQTQVYLVRVEEPGPNGIPQVRWSGGIPLKWDWHEIHSLQRTIGADEIICNFCRVIRGKFLDLDTLVYPAALEDYRVRRFGAKVDMTVMLQARSTESSSPITPFRIAWDGQWDDGDAEMARHLIIEKVVPPVPFDPGAP